MATPATPPITPVTRDSPMIWRMIRRLLQPIALSVPNSRTRRVTADMVRMLAMRKAAASTATASHLPRLLASVDALDRDPVTSLARSLDVDGRGRQRLGDLARHRADVRRARGRHVDRVDLVRHVRQGLGSRQRNVDVRVG